jgi:hypothetical protein
MPGHLSKLIMILSFILLIIPQVSAVSFIYGGAQQKELGKQSILSADVIAVSDSNPLYSILGSSLACYYTANESILKPFLIYQNDTFSAAQARFLMQYGESNLHIISIGAELATGYPHTSFLGSPTEISLQLCTLFYSRVDSAIILPVDIENSYELGLQIAPLASYLHIPLLIYEDNDFEIRETLKRLQVSTLYIVGYLSSPALSEFQQIMLHDSRDIQNTVLSIINKRFGALNYITLTNPSDTIPVLTEDIDSQTYMYDVSSTQIIIPGATLQLQGSDRIQEHINVKEGIVHLSAYATVVSTRGLMAEITGCDIIVGMTIRDPDGKIVSYTYSSGYEISKTFGFTFIIEKPGNYSIEMTVFHGYRGGFFVPRGLSFVDATIELTVHQRIQQTPHLPLIPDLSMNAAYITSAHGGILLADDNWQITTPEYITVANACSTGPWYDESLHHYNNGKVNETVSCLMENLSILEQHSLLNRYLSGPAWLAIVADTNMIPMYYYQPSQGSLVDRGLPSDNPYSLNHSLSVGRILGYDASDVSVLICRTLFYEKLCGPPLDEGGWHTSFSFIFGGGYGETGGFFHQIPYSKEITQYGFQPTIYGILRNGRHAAERLGTYVSTNYIEYLGHGDWYWFTPSLYNMDLYGTAIDVAHAKDWVYERPSVFLTSACLMGRVDGLYPFTSIGLTMLHAGCNAFVGSTRETGRESGLEVMEDHLIVDDYSLGEALRGEKQIDQVPPTYYVRTLYGDPAFNPYEPNNGFTSQGRPLLIDT